MIVAGAGGAAHLPGMTASMTPLPVIGVPVPLAQLDGLDSLLSIVQMPAGVPVATVAVGNAKNAGLLAVRILATSDEKLPRRDGALPGRPRASRCTTRTRRCRSAFPRSSASLLARDRIAACRASPRAAPGRSPRRTPRDRANTMMISECRAPATNFVMPWSCSARPRHHPKNSADHERRAASPAAR